MESSRVGGVASHTSIGVLAGTLWLLASATGAAPPIAPTVPGEDLETQISGLDGEHFELARAIEQADLEAREAERLWLAAQDRLAALEEPNDLAVERVASARLSLQLAQRRLDILESRLAGIEQTREDVTLWHELLDGAPSRKELRAAVPDLREREAELERRIRGATSRVRQLEDRLEGLDARLAGLPADGPMAALVSRQRRDVEALLHLHHEDVEHLEREVAVPTGLLAEIRTRTGEESAGDRLERVVTSMRRLWNYELVEVEDSSITLGKTLLALVLLIFGFLLSKLIATLLGHRVFPRMGMDEGGSVAFQTLIFYLSLTAFFLWSLRVVHIPLTVFTVVGGALAIGVGFGSQNIVNNFISGLILLTERPIKVGDLIEVGGTHGEVERIGPRSTRIRSGDNTHVIVPNSWFLENSVLNWTLADDSIRAWVDVGVAYGSDTRKVTELLQRAATEHPAVLPVPKPEVLFTEFGDNALLFQVHFWIRASTVMDRKRLESGLRMAIDALFRDAGITIAFPQRDVHLDVGSPVPVRVVGDDEGA